MLTLILGDYSINFTAFLDKKLPRTQVEPVPSLSYSLAGTACATGSLFSPKAIWQINALLTNCTQNDEAILNIIYAEFDRLRRSLNNPGLTLIDYIQKVTEPTENIIHTIAPNTSVTEIGDYSSFYAQFDVFFTQPPAYTQDGVYRSVSLTLVEI